ncbi:MULTISPECIES: hypothetical protein [unclassified Mesorhizobium]|uniref:hypothetical protein n=1 Tax=unclassified Mesorhizobium TaxID=325217 RepID=UPI00112C9D8E|nr:MULTISPECIES: hypothetical protein [unclassified Mesorhizobium]TPJ70499.1 hypothetical protein FJ462_07340 [Mesorhizobium sp. B2-6-7]TPJ76844.1 hypothetical protein FJ422_29480 [Mesorhizobium sp. B2-6-3]
MTIERELRERATWRAANEGPFTKENLVEWRAAAEIERLREDVLAVYDECESVAVPPEEGSFQQVEAYRRTIRALKARALTIPSDKEGGDHG